MRIVGVIATGGAGVLVALGLLLGVRSIPDIKRYMKIRSM